MVQHDHRCDQSRSILQHSPLVTDEFLVKLEGRKLYRHEYQRDGITAMLVSLDAVVSEQKNSNSAGEYQEF